jgi:Tol biopolymer transport system component
MRGDGSGAHLIPTTPGVKTDPVISPDGTRIVFTVGPIEIGTASPLWIVNTDGTGLHQLTTDGANDFRPTWSRGGSEIAFVSTRDGNAEIYIMNADGTSQQNITNDPADDNSPSWSPVGNVILFSSDRDSVAGTQVYSILPSLVVTPLTSGSNPEWSPSGSRFLFERGSQIWISENTTGSSVRQVTFDEGFHLTPGWSPDESTLVYAASNTANEEIWSAKSADGSAVTQLTLDSDGDNFTPNWTRH